MGKRILLINFVKQRFCFKSAFTQNRLFSYSSINMSDHLSVTQASSRKEIIAPATVAELQDISDTVKMLSLYIENKDFTFKAGQWVDTFIPGLDTVGGFSMCSSPGLLQTQHILKLAVKFSKHPPAYWVHTRCKTGDTLHVRAGGDFFFDPHPGDKTAKDVLLIAGGVGINPLYSMVQHVADLNQSPKGVYAGHVQLLYSARTHSELIFKDHLEQISFTNANISTQFHVTREPAVPNSIKVGRIQHEDVEKAVSKLRAETLNVYMCGPSPMVHNMEDYCIDCGLSESQIFYERWW